MKMRYNIKALMCALGLAGLMASCDNWTPLLEKEGTLQLSDMAVSITDHSRAATDLADYKVVVKNGDAIVKEWRYAELPEVFSMAVGNNYSVVAYSHEVKKAAWEEPYYRGSKSFKIEENRITNVGTVECVLANIKVQVTFSDNLKEIMGDDCKVTVVANHEGELEFTKDETRAGYFEYIDGSTTLVATLKGTINGEEVEVVQPFDNVQSGKFFDLTFDLNNKFPVPDGFGGEIGTDGIKLTLDVTTHDQEGNISHEDKIIDPGKRPDHEDPKEDDKPDTPDTPDNPTAPAATFTPSEDLNLNGVNKPSEFGDGTENAPGTKKALVTINCPGKFAHIVVDINSPYLTAEFMAGIQFSTHFDLCEPGEYETTLKGFNFSVGDEVKGKTETDFDITNLVPLLSLSGDDTMEHKFVITVTDEEGKSSTQTLTFREK